MEKVAVVFTVFFEEPFWCGVYQRAAGIGCPAGGTENRTQSQK